MPRDILEVRDLAAYYETGGSPTRAVDHVSFGLKSEEILGIAGESGCGKSTLALAVLRLLKPPGYVKSGEVIFDGVDLLGLEEEAVRKVRWKRISYIPQSSMNALNPVMRIKDQIADSITTHEGKQPRGELKERVEKLLVSVGLAPEVARMYPHELSGGMRQRTIIATAMALNPDLIIADEPTTALDVVVQRGILQLLRSIRDDMRKSIILITHDMAAQAEIVDKTCIMYAGKIVEIGRAEFIFKNPLHPYTQLLISSIPSIRAKRRLAGITGLPPDLRNPPSGCHFHPRCPHMMPNKCNAVEPQLKGVKPEGFVACHLYGGKE